MKEKESHPIRNGIIATAVGGILLSFLPLLGHRIPKMLSCLWGLVVSCGNYLLSAHDVYGWVIIALGFLSLCTIVFVIGKLIQNAEPSYQKLYTEDYLFGAMWHWTYVNGSISNLCCLCPQCKSELVYGGFEPDPFNLDHDGKRPQTYFICEKCKVRIASLEGRKDYAIGRVEREIRRKIRTNEWKTKET